MNEAGNGAPNRVVMVYTLAAIGFVALVAGSMWLAAYSARYVPEVVTRAASAAVYLGSLFSASSEAILSVVPTPAAPAIDIGTTAARPVDAVTATPEKPRVAPAATVAGGRTNTTLQISGATTSPSLSGLPDLVVTINAIGYLASSTTDSFVASTTVPSDMRPAVSFTIKNVGANATGAWRFSAMIPTQVSYLYQSQPQQSLNPGDSIDYTLGFDQATRGADKMISITANFDRAVSESNPDNNSASALVTILGG